MLDEVDHFDWLVDLCRQAEGAEQVLMWGNELVFSFSEVMFCLFHIEGRRKVSVSFRPHPDERDQLLEQEGVRAASFPAEGGWLLVTEDACDPGKGSVDIPREKLGDWVRRSYELARSEAA